MTHLLGLVLMVVALLVLVAPLYWLALRLDATNAELRANPPRRCRPGCHCRGTAPHLRG